MNLDNVIGTSEAADILGLSPDHVKLLCRQGKIKSKRIGKTWIIDKTKLEVKPMNKLSEIYALIEENEKKLGDAELQLEGQKIIIIDDNAESSDDAFIWEGYGIYEAYEFLSNNGFLKSSE